MTDGSAARRLLYLRDTLTICGPGKTIVNTWRTIDRGRFHITVGATRPTPQRRNDLLDALNRLGAPTIECSIGRGLDVIAVGRLIRVIRQQGIEILQTHDAQTRRLGILAAAATGVHHVASVHGWIFNDAKQKAAKWLDARLIGRADRVIAVSDRLRQDLEEAGVPAHRIAVVRNAILLDDYANSCQDPELRRELGVPANHQVVSMIGRLSPEKGHAIFLQAARAVIRTTPSVTFLIVGDGPLEAELRTLAKTLEIEDRVVFAGYRSQMASIYALTDILAISSYTEGIPNVLLEAFAYGKPAVATDVGGVAEVLRDGHSGWLTVAGDAAGMAERLLRLLDHADQRSRMGVAARDSIAERFSFEHRTRTIERLYDNLTSTAGPSHA